MLKGHRVRKVEDPYCRDTEVETQGRNLKAGPEEPSERNTA